MDTDFERRDSIIKLRNEGKTYGEISKILGCKKGIIAFYCNPNRYDFARRNSERDEYERIIVKAVPKCYNINQVCRMIGKKGTNTNIRLIKEIIDKHNIDTSHFSFDGSVQGKCKRYTMDEIFCENSEYKTKSMLKILLLKHNLKSYKCECCGNSEWMGNPIPLQTHHINGNNTDNRISNLQLLCPNCHAATDNYCGKNKKKSSKDSNHLSVCKMCENVFVGKGIFCSKECMNEYNKKRYKLYTNGVNKEKLIDSFLRNKTFSSVGNEFGVSDKTISKWCKKFELPSTAKEMKEFIKNKAKRI